MYVTRDLEAVQAQEEASLTTGTAQLSQAERDAQLGELRQKHQAQKSALAEQLTKMDDDMHLVLTDQHEKFQQMDTSETGGGMVAGLAKGPELRRQQTRSGADSASNNASRELMASYTTASEK